MRRPLAAIAAALVVSVATLAGCGSGSHSGAAAPTTSTSTSGKASFLVKANAICAATSAQTKGLGAGLGPNPSRADQAAALDKGADLIDAGVSQVRRLAQPGGDRTYLIRFYQRSQQLLVLTRQLADAFRADDVNKVTSIETKANALDDDLTKAADAYGLTACGSGSQG